ncbi:adenosine kinase [Ruficoccus amylovorans]|uniref:Adenosine kinase n=1 Tax=Ruficoccus amylovorans TaxID=1804625 RepID=A0A842HGW1_9BACT|nr:adenosine kinase [Ruficoccus amylovorans]MBC2595549.1 adenosine kinase [Ruficoccus amylovorans]
MSEKQFELIGVGSPIVDSLAQVEETFVASIPGEKGGMELVDATTMGELMAQVESPMTEAPGGSAGNTAVAVARLGLPTTFLGKIGNDAGGEFYKDRFVELGGDGSRFKVGAVPNGRCLSLVTPDSERTMRTDLGAAMTLSPDEVSVEDFRGCRHAHIEGYILFNRELMFKVLNSAKAAGCTVSIDLASFEVVGATKDILPDILSEYVDVVFANEGEAGALFDSTDYEKMVAELAGMCEVAVVKLGKAGSLIQQGKTLEKIAPVLVNQSVDTTGAGDLWAAGFLYGWLRGRPLATCGHYGSVMGAEIVQVMGAAIPHDRWPGVRKLLEA